MAKRTGSNWKTIVVVVLVAAMLIGLLGLNIFASIKYAPPDNSTANTTPPPPLVGDIQVQTEGNVPVKTTPQ